MIKERQDLEDKILENRWNSATRGKKVSFSEESIKEHADFLLDIKPKVDSVRAEKYNGQYTFKKMIVSGDIVEIYHYEKPVFYGYTDERKTGRAGTPEEELPLNPFADDQTGEILGYHKMKSPLYVSGEDGMKKFIERENYRKQEALEQKQSENRQKVLYRARKTVLRTANANTKELDKFLTLTFRDDVQDVAEANADFTNFVKRMKYWLKVNKKPDFKYIVVMEFTKAGRVHYHLLCNLPYIKSKTIEEIWGQGFIKIKKKRIDKVDNIGAYITKYMSKDLGDERLEGKKSFFMSRNLEKPQEDLNETRIDMKIKKLPEGCQTFESEFETEHLGNVRYVQYNLSKQYQVNKKENQVKQMKLNI